MFGWGSEAPAESARSGGTARSKPTDLVPVEQSTSGRPRGKALAKERQKELRQWERTRSYSKNIQFVEDDVASSGDEKPEEDEGPSMIMDDGSDAGDGSPKMSGGRTMDFFGTDVLAPLGSYEQRVLGLDRGESAQGDARKSVSASKQAEQDSAASREKELHHRKKLLMREKLLEEERLNKEMVAKIADESGINAVQASRVIVSVARVKLKMMGQKMKLYEDSEQKMTDTVLRARKLLNWTATLSVLSKFADKMRTPLIRKTMEDQYLKSLPAPPPPPPLAAPPDAGDEELHEKYENIIEKYRPQWMEEGRKALGEEKFEALRNMKDGPAAREKKLVAQKCIDQARGVLSQEGYLELLRKAWRLSDDHAALEEYDQHAFATKIANMESTSSSSTKRSS